MFQQVKRRRSFQAWDTMIELPLRSILAARIDIEENGARVLTVVTSLSTVTGSPDWEAFCSLRSELYRLVNFKNGYDQVRIISWQASDFLCHTIRAECLGDPAL
jgi:hypothetical protein